MPANKIHIPHAVPCWAKPRTQITCGPITHKDAATTPHATAHTRDTSSIRHNLTSPRAHNLATSQQHQPPRSGVVNTVQPHSQSQSHAPGSRHTLTEYETLCSSPQAPACTNDQNSKNKTCTCNHNHAQAASCLSYATHVSKRYNASHHTFHMLASVCQVVT